MICDSVLLEDEKNRRYTLSWCRTELTGWINITRMFGWCSSERTWHRILYADYNSTYSYTYPYFIHRRSRSRSRSKKIIQIVFLPPLWFQYHKNLSMKKTHTHQFVVWAQMNEKKISWKNWRKCVRRSKCQMGTVNL